ncbi:ABC transporter substrate-binding protein [Kineococcus siccus]|uniref:ABC transporter substrate-binding protein n=1 Tax=Kineococcus siccus TaxID=2696567 RepID=UPI00196A40AA|nr:extracellular solute-binding protein [Kineococcus siccus]
MRTPLTVATLAALALVATSCSSGPQSAAQGAGDDQTLRVTSISDSPGTDAVVAAFEKANPGVKVQLDSAPVDAVQTNIRTQLSSGTAPDVFIVWPGDGSPTAVRVVAGAGYLADLSAEPWVATVPEGIKPLLGAEGKTYLASSTVAAITPIYNQAAMTEVGVTPPTTWSQLLSMCDAAKAKGKVAFALGNQTNWITQLIDYALAATLVYGKEPDFPAQMAAGKVTFADSGWKTTMDKYLEMNSRGCFNPNPLGTSYESSLTMVAKGEALGVVQVNSALPQLQSQAAPGTQFTTAALPATDDPAETVMPLAAGAGFAVNAKAKNMELAKKFVAFTMSPEALKINAESGNQLSSIPLADVKADPAFDAILAAQESGRTTPFMDQSWPNARVQQTHFTVVQQIFSGSATVPEALAEMDKAYEQG